MMNRVDQPPKLPIGHLFSDALALCGAYRLHLAFLGCISIAANLVGDILNHMVFTTPVLALLLVNPQAGIPPGPVAFGVILGMTELLVFAGLATYWLRLTAIGPARIFEGGRSVFLQSSALLWLRGLSLLLLAAFVFSLVFAMVTRLVSHGTGMATGVGGGLAIALGMIVSLAMLARLALFPLSAAFTPRLSLSEAWRLMGGNGWRFILVGLVIMLPFDLTERVYRAALLGPVEGKSLTLVSVLQYSDRLVTTHRSWLLVPISALWVVCYGILGAMAARAYVLLVGNSRLAPPL